jgi:Spy/CpxP family protein refolding chaperone
MRKTVLLLCLAALFLGASSVRAERPWGNDEKPQERLEIITMWKLMEALNLDKPTADKIFEIRHSFLDRRKQLKKALGEDLAAIRLRLKESSDSNDKELEKLLQNLRETRKKLADLHDQQYEEVSKVLTLRQRAELVLFFRDFYHEMRALTHQQMGPDGKSDRKMMRPSDGPPEP